MKQKFPDLKRNIRFNDDTMDLILHFSTNRFDGDPWKKVRPSQAKSMRQRIARPRQEGPVEMTDEDLEKMMENDQSKSSGPS